MRDDPGRLRDVLDAIDRVQQYAAKGREEFDQNELHQTWIVYHLQIIGEAARGLSKGLRSANPQVPWADVIAMRNILIHEYFGIDLQEVWDTAVNDLPKLREQVEEMLRSAESADTGQ